MASVAARLFINGDEAYTMESAKPAEWIFELYDPGSPEPIHHFHPMHGKEVHTFVVSEDLSFFSHFHPNELGNHLGLFGINVNQGNSDPDSHDAATAVMQGGKYFLFLESMPMEQLMSVVGLDFEATGNPRPAGGPVVASPENADGVATIIHDDYRISVTHESLPHPGTFVVMIHAHVEQFDAASGDFKPVLDLEPWLLTYGHAVMISTFGEGAPRKKLLHLHASYPIIDDPSSGSGPDIDLAADTPVPPREGLYKTWLQFKHHGQIRTVPMALEVKKPAPFRGR
jgi:hypothetical protein